MLSCRFCLTWWQANCDKEWVSEERVNEKGMSVNQWIVPSQVKSIFESWESWNVEINQRKKREKIHKLNFDTSSAYNIHKNMSRLGGRRSENEIISFTHLDKSNCWTVSQVGVLLLVRKWEDLDTTQTTTRKQQFNWPLNWRTSQLSSSSTRRDRREKKKVKSCRMKTIHEHI